MTPNKPVDEDTRKEIRDMTDKYSLGYTAKILGLHVNTVRKYAKDDENKTNIDDGI